MTDADYIKLGKYIYENLNKLMSGEYKGTAVICPIKPEKHGGICKIQINMPTEVYWRTETDDEGNITRHPVSLIWSPAQKTYVVQDEK